jgi:hypothetical protein
MNGLLIGFIVVGVLILIAVGGGLAYYFMVHKKAQSGDVADSASVVETSETPETPAIANPVSVPPAVAATAISVPPTVTAKDLLAQPPVTTTKGNTSQFVPISNNALPKSPSGKPAPAPPGTTWIGQKVTTNTGKTVTIPILAPTRPPKQNIVTTSIDGKKLPPPPKGMVWVRKTIRKGGKSAKITVLEPRR